MAVLAIAASSFAAAPAALAQEVGPDDVIIEAVYPTAIAGLEDLVFDVTRGSAPTEDLLVLVTLSPGILSAIEQTLPVLILANSTGTRLSVSTRIFIESAPTGDVTATVVDGDDYDVGDPSTATVRVFVGEGAVAAKVGFSAPGYTLNESVGTTTDQIRLTVRTNPGTPVPRHLTVPVWTRDGTAASVDDYSELSGTITFLPPWTIEETPDGDVYSAEESVRVSIVDDDESEGDERFTVWVGLPTESPDSVSLVTTDSAPECDSDGCGSYVTIVDNDDDTRSVEVSRTSLIINESRHEGYTVVLGSQPTDDVTITAEVTDATGSDIAVTPYLTFTPQNWNTQTVMLVSAKADDNRLHGSATITHTVTGADYGDNDVTAPSVQVSEIDTEGRTVVTLGMVPDGTVLPDVLAITVGETVEDGSTFVEGERALFRLLFTAADGGRAAYGANVELRFEWTHHSPTVPRSGEVSLIELSLPRVDVWDSAVRILDNDVGNPDGTLTMRITGCERHGCIIGTPSEITVTIVDDDGGPAAAPPGSPETPRLVCASAGGRYEPTAIAASWQAPAFVGGAPISGYDVQYQQRIAGGDPWVWDQWQAWPHTGTATSTTIAGLDADSLYGVRVRVVNANGPGQWSLPNTFSTGHSQDLCEIINELTP